MHAMQIIHVNVLLNSISEGYSHEGTEIKKKEIKIRLSQSDNRILICYSSKVFHPSRSL